MDQQNDLSSVFSFNLSFQEIRQRLHVGCSCGASAKAQDRGGSDVPFSHASSCPVGALYQAWSAYASSYYGERLRHVPVRMPRLREMHAQSYEE